MSKLNNIYFEKWLLDSISAESHRHLFYNFDDNFKAYINNQIWDDGYDFYWKEPNESHSDRSNCLIYFLHLLYLPIIYEFLF